MTDYIIASSGFILPANNYFKPFEPKDTITDAIFNRSIVTSLNPQVLKFYQDKNVFRSETINSALNDYLSTKSFEDYINLINIATDIFKEIDFSSFFKLQATNVNLSPISFKFCLDVVSGKFISNYNEYSIIPFNIRFVINNGLTNDKVLDNIRQLEKSSYYISNWETFLSELSNNKDALLTFIKYILADYY
jgi:hypothetical protein